MRRITPLAALAALLGASPAYAAGWDTPILYSAEHMGMGGAAIAYVDDPSAMFHNPAGLVRTHGLTLMANGSLLFGGLRASPSDSQRSIETEPQLALAPLVGVSYRITDWMAAGLGFFAVGAASGTYLYPNADGVEVTNKTAGTFLELSPALSFNLPGRVNLGIGYRLTFASLQRVLLPGAPLNFDAALSGFDAEGLRFGAQWDPIPELQIGVVFRTKLEVELEDDSAVVGFFGDERDERVARTNFTLPAKLGFGVRLNFHPLSIVTDLEYTFQSQNEESVFAFDPDLPLTINNIFRWKDTITLRAGLEYNVDDRFFFRGGFVYDGQATQKAYPSAFGTPPTPTTTITGGFGYRHNTSWGFNVAVAHRVGSVTIRDDEVAPPGECAACGFGGDYKMGITGIYLDFRYSFDL